MFSSQNANKTLIAAMLATSTLAGGIGCTSPATRGEKSLSSMFEAPQWTKKMPWSKKADEMPKPYPNPAKMAATWTPDVLVQSGRTPTRGFGGRFFFFDEKSKTVPVEGTLTIHGFETESKSDNDAKIRPFKFTPEQFTSHFSQSDFGASYSIWVPWDAVGGFKKRVSLVATFETTAGKIVQGTPVTVILPGRASADEEQNSAMAGGIASSNWAPQYHNHKEAMGQHATRPSGLSTTTIARRDERPSETLRPGSSALNNRIEAIAAAARGGANGQTPYVDVPLGAPRFSQGAPDVMPASAQLLESQMPTQTQTKRASVPRRIQMPTSNR